MGDPSIKQKKNKKSYIQYMVEMYVISVYLVVISHESNAFSMFAS